MSFLLKKREFLNLVLRGPLMYFASYGGVGVRLAKAQSPENSLFTAEEESSLERISYLLFPYPDLGRDVYGKCVAVIVAAVSGRPDAIALVRAGLEKLDSLAGGSWIGLHEEEQISLLQEVEGDEFFSLVYLTSLNRIYTDKSVWNNIGYEGSSLEFGGYLNRGFNDINWL